MTQDIVASNLWVIMWITYNPRSDSPLCKKISGFTSHDKLLNIGT